MKRGTKYNQGDIVLIPFPYSDLSSNQMRPALIISNLFMNKTEDRICCLVTRNLRKDDLPIKKEDFKGGILPFKSVVRPYRVFTVHQGIIKKRICTINDGFHNRVISRLNEYLKKI